MKKLLLLVLFLVGCSNMQTKPDEHYDPKYIDCYTNNGEQHVKQFPQGLLYFQYTKSDGPTFTDPQDHCFK